MTRWKELPAPLDQRVRQLTVHLRALKDRSGLSLTALAAKTSYSRSSWERYLNGKKLPPRDAVEALARVCGADPVRLLALHEVAVAAVDAGRGAGTGGAAAEAGGGAVEAGGVEAGGGVAAGGVEVADAGAGGGARAAEGAGRGARRARRPWVVAAAVGGVLVVVAVVLVLVRPWAAEEADPGRPGPGQGAFVVHKGQDRPCEVTREGGALYAGHSRTRDKLLDTNSTGWEVVEAQCLLRRHGYAPGIADGVYGERTKEAARRFQRDEGLGVDGIVGPDTWGALRR